MNLIWLDIEATGTDPSNDRIIELAVRGRTRHRWIFNPGIPIPPEATAVHGYRDSDVADRPTFSGMAEVLQDLFGHPDAVLEKMPARALYDSYRPATERFIAGLREAAAADEPVEFH